MLGRRDPAKWGLHLPIPREGRLHARGVPDDHLDRRVRAQSNKLQVPWHRETERACKLSPRSKISGRHQ